MTVKIEYRLIGETVWEISYKLIGHSPSGKEMWQKVPGSFRECDNPEALAMFKKEESHADAQVEAGSRTADGGGA